MVMARQNADGSESVLREIDLLEVARFGGPKSPTQTSPTYIPGSVLVLAGLGGTDTGGGIASWQNNLGTDIIIDACWWDITTGSSGACTAEVGTGATSTTANAGLIAATSVASTGQLKPGAPIAVRLTANNFITSSTATGASAGLVSRIYVSYTPVCP